MAKKNQKISIADLDIGMNSFTEFVLQGLQGSVYFHDIISDSNLFTSENLVKRIGYSIDELADFEHSLRSIIHPDDLPEVERMNSEVRFLKDGEFAEATYRIKHKSGKWVWHKSEEYVYKRDSAGNPVVVFGVAHDVTQLKQKEIELQELADHNAFLVEISRLITAGQGNMKATLQQLAERLAEHFNVVCSIFFVDEKDNSIQPGAVYYHDQELVNILTDLFPKTTVKVGEGMVGKVIENGGEYVISEADEDIRKRTAAVNPKLEAVGLAYLPIKGLSKTVGAISLVQLIEFEPFSAEQWEVIAQVVRNVSLFVEHSIITNERKDELLRLERAESELIERNASSNFQLEMSKLLSDYNTDKRKLLAKAAKRLAQHFKAGCEVHLLNEDDHIEPIAYYHSKNAVRKQLDEQYHRKKWLKEGEGLLGQVIEDGVEFIVWPNDPILLEKNGGVSAELRVSSLVYMPVVGLGQTIGTVGLKRLKQDPPFTEREHDEIRQAVKNISLFVDGRLQFEERQEELKKRREVEAELLEINRSNAFQLEVSKVLGDFSSDKLKTLYTLAKMISIHFDAVSDIHIIQDDLTLEPVAWYHPKRSVRKKVGDMFDLGRFKVGQGILGKVAENGEEFLLQQLDVEFYGKVSKLDKEVRACSFIYLPLIGYDKVIGIFGLSRLMGQSEFTEQELGHIRLVVGTISRFLDNRLLFEARDAQLALRTKAEYHLMELDRFNQFLLGVSQQLSDLTSDMTEVLQALAESVTYQFDVACNILLVDVEKLFFKPLAVSHKDAKLKKSVKAFFSHMKFRWDYGIVGDVVKNGRPLRITKVGTEHRHRFDTTDDELVPGSLVYLPIKGREGTIGILDVTRVKGESAITDDEVDQLREVASNISLFITNHLEFEQRQQELERRIKAEKELTKRTTQIERAEKEMRGILDTMPILVARIDTEHRYRFANRAYASLLGQEQQSLVGMHLSEIIGATAYDRVRPYYDKVLAGGIARYENSGIMSDGDRHYFNLVNAPDYGPNGNVIGVLSCIIDVTHQTIAEKELESSEVQLKVVFDNVDAHISTFDRNGIIETVNRTAQGLTKEDVIGTPIVAFFADDRQKRELEKNLNKLLNSGSPFEMENSLTGPDGSIRHYHNRYVGVFDDDVFSKGIIITRDVTEEREKERMEMQAMIKGQESERKRVAADMHDGVGQILSAISIELSQLRTKNTVVKSELDSLSEKVQHGIVEVRNVSHALKPDVLEHFGLVPAIEEVCSTLSSDIGPAISFNHIDVERRFNEDVEINIYRIVQELLNNCIKHANANDVFVTLIKDNDSLLLTVEDDGQGISPSDHTGIGMNNVKLRVGLINGEIEIDSAKGKGSLINIEVPI